MLRRVATVGLNQLLSLRKIPATHGTSVADKCVGCYESFCSENYMTPAWGFSAYRFYCVNSKPHMEEINLSDEESKRKTLNRLVYRSKQRGLLELDLVLGKWVEENIHSMDETAIKSLVQVLDLENPTLWRWLTGQEQAPEEVIANPVFSAIREKVKSNLDSHASPETRAVPGQPWVRGWDDIKRGRDSPITGNQ